MDDISRQKLRNRIRRAQGQLAAAERAIDDTDDCVALMHRLSAVEGALAKARAALLTHHVESCVATALASGDATARMLVLDALMDVVGKQLGR